MDSEKQLAYCHKNCDIITCCCCTSFKFKLRFIQYYKFTQFLFLFLSICCLSSFVINKIDFINAFYIDEHQSPATKHWSYNEQHNWPTNFSQCGKRAQSPIDITHKHVIYNNHLKLNFYNYNKLIKFKIQNAHHTVKLNPIYELQQQFNKNQFIVDSNGQLIHDRQQQNVDSSSSSSSSRTSDDTIDDGGDVQDLINYDEVAKQQQQQQQDKANNLGRKSQHLSRFLPPNNKYNAADDDEYNRQQLSVLATSADGERANIKTQNSDLPYNGVPTIKLDWLDDGNNEFTLHDIHFHWAERKDNGSEHAIEGRRAAMEMHLVHIKRGLEKSKISFTSDSVAVIGVLIESYKKSNADFNPIVNALSQLNATETHVDIEYKALEDLLPTSLSQFYTYSGSLTTPPCLEVVNWIVLRDRLYLNAKQMELFRNMYAPPNAATTSHSFPSGSLAKVEPMMPNIRQLNPINNRAIFSSFFINNGNVHINGGGFGVGRGPSSSRPGSQLEFSNSRGRASSLHVSIVESYALSFVSFLLLLLLLRKQHTTFS